MKQKRNSILLVSPLPPPIGGITTWTMDYISQMKKMGHHVCLVNSSVIGERLKNNRKINIVEEIKRALYIRKGIKENINTNSVLHYNASCFTFGLVRDYFVLSGFYDKIPIVYQCHCNLDTNISNPIARLFFSLICKKASLVLTLNNDSMRLAKTYTQKVDVIPNFITEIYKTEVEINREFKNVVFVGRVSINKGILELLDVARHNEDLNFHIVGPDNDGLLNNCNLKNVIKYGARSHDDVISIMKKMDCLVLPSYSEGFPLVVMEAMSCALPIIASNVGAIPEMIEGKGGILIEPKDIDGLNKAIKYIKSCSKRIEMATFNIKKCKKYYIYSSVIEKLLRLYGEV